MKAILNWRQWVLNGLALVWVAAILLLSNESSQTLAEWLNSIIISATLFLTSGFLLCKLTRKWEQEGKITFDGN